MTGEFRTERLLLRPLAFDDLDLVTDLNRDADVMRYITGRASSIEESEAELKSAIGTRWVVFDRSDGTFLGWVGAVPTTNGTDYEVGWRFRRVAWGSGYATEAARALVDRLFSEGARRVFAQTMAVNERSRAVMERLGLRYSRTLYLEFDDPLPGTEHGEVEYEVTLAEWQRARR